jgi:hypothetical protein
MAKSPVRTQMTGTIPSLTGSKGTYGHNHPPFSHAHDVGHGGIPVKFFDGTPTKKLPAQSSPGSVGAQRPHGKKSR